MLCSALFYSSRPSVHRPTTELSSSGKWQLNFEAQIDIGRTLLPSDQLAFVLTVRLPTAEMPFTLSGRRPCRLFNVLCVMHEITASKLTRWLAGGCVRATACPRVLTSSFFRVSVQMPNWRFNTLCQYLPLPYPISRSPNGASE